MTVTFEQAMTLAAERVASEGNLAVRDYGLDLGHAWAVSTRWTDAPEQPAGEPPVDMRGRLLIVIDKETGVATSANFAQYAGKGLTWVGNVPTAIRGPGAN